MLDSVTADYAIDTSRIYVTSHSAGSGMANQLIEEMPERFAALAPVGAPGATFRTAEALAEAAYNTTGVAYGDAASRAYAGLSMAARGTSKILIAEPGLFGYAGVFSGGPNAEDWAELQDTESLGGIRFFLGAGFADNILAVTYLNTERDWCTVSFAHKLDEIGVSYNNGNGIEIVQGGHDWFTWPQLLRDFVTDILWK